MKLIAGSAQPAFDVIQPDAASQDASIDNALKETVAALEKELGSLRQDVEESRKEPAPAPTHSGPDAAALALVLERIDNRLTALEQRPVPTPAVAPAPVPAPVPLDDLRDELQAAWQADLQAFEKKQAAALAAHSLAPSTTPAAPETPAWEPARERIEKRLAALEGRPMVSETAIKTELQRAWQADMAEAVKKVVPPSVQAPVIQTFTPAPVAMPTPHVAPVVISKATEVALGELTEDLKRDTSTLPPLLAEHISSPNFIVRFWRYLNQPAFRS